MWKKLWPPKKVRPHLTAKNELTLWRDNLVLTMMDDGHGLCLRIQFGPDDYSFLNQKEMKQLVDLITNGTNDAK